jgi:charged multivesicular body protein 2A
MGSVKIMAKDLVRTRTYITKFIEMRSHLNGAALKLQTVKSHQALAESMSSVAKAMVKVNKSVNVPAINKMMQDFAKENEKSELMQEMMGDAMDDVMEGNEEEEEQVVNQVLDEIGITFNEEVPDAPSGVGKGEEKVEEKQAQPTAEAAGEFSELEARLNNLRRD